jgi:hypothetical protein
MAGGDREVSSGKFLEEWEFSRGKIRKSIFTILTANCKETTMKRLVMIAGVLAVLAGCSTLPRDSGYEVRSIEPAGRQEPWQNKVVRADPAYRDGLSIAYVKLPIPLPERWRSEFTDPARKYWVESGGSKVRRTLERVVWRANLYHGTTYVKTYDAVRYLEGGLTVLVPTAEAALVRGHSLLILSSDGRWGMTTLGAFVEFIDGVQPDRLPEDFFRRHSSPVRQLVDLHPEENEHAREVLVGLNRLFPQPFRLRGKDAVYAGQRDALAVLGQFTSLEGTADRIISCTDFKIGAETFHPAALPIVGTIYGIQAAIALSKRDCLK